MFPLSKRGYPSGGNPKAALYSLRTGAADRIRAGHRTDRLRITRLTRTQFRIHIIGGSLEA